MKKINTLLLVLLCTLASTFVSCELWEESIENSITDTWTNIGGDSYYSYTFYYDDTYYYEEGLILSSGKFSATGYSNGEYDFSNYRKELTLYPYNQNTIFIYNAYIKDGVLYIEDTTDNYGNWYYSVYYK